MKRLSEVALFTDQVAELTAFYEHLLDASPTYKADDIAVFKLSGDITLLIHKKYPPVEGQPPNENHIAFEATDVHAVAVELAQQSIPLLLEPRRYDWGTSAYLRDPDGHLLEIHSAGE